MTPGDIVIRSGGDRPAARRQRRSPAAPDRYDLYVIRKRHIWRPPTDVYETDRHVVVRVEIAGMDECDLSISLADGRLTVTGERRENTAPGSKLTYQNMEILYGEFRTEVDIGWTIDEPAIEARYERGILSITLPKTPQRRIPVTTREG